MAASQGSVGENTEEFGLSGPEPALARRAGKHSLPIGWAKAQCWRPSAFSFQFSPSPGKVGPSHCHLSTATLLPALSAFVWTLGGEGIQHCGGFADTQRERERH